MSYTIEPVRGLADCWKIYADGVVTDSGQYYRSQEAAAEVVARKERYDELNALVEAEIGQDRNYGVQVWSEPRPGTTPRWYRTDPHSGKVAFAFAWYQHEPPPVSEYTRDQYERACRAAGVEAAPDADLGTYADQYADLWPTQHEAVVVITTDLRRRRMAGLRREELTPPPTAAIETESETDGQCDECGKDIIAGQAMTASLGRACGTDCYDAMADRRGRHANRR